MMRGKCSRVGALARFPVVSQFENSCLNLRLFRASCWFSRVYFATGTEHTEESELRILANLLVSFETPVIYSEMRRQVPTNLASDPTSGSQPAAPLDKFSL